MVASGAVPFLLLLCVLHFWAGVHSHVCDGLCNDIFCNKNGCIVPPESFSYIGKELVLNCTLRNLGHANSSMLYFTRGNDVNISYAYQTVISPYVLELRVPVRNTSLNEVTMKCVVGGVAGWPWTRLVRVDYPLREVGNVSFVVHDWKNVSISWQMFDYLYTPMVKVSWAIPGNLETLGVCDSSGVSWCFLDSYQEDMVYEIIVNVSSNISGVSLPSTFSFNSGVHVQPGAVSWMKVFIVDSRCVCLEWNHTRSESRNLTYRLSLHPTSKNDREKTDQWMTIRRTSKRVCALTADTEYRASVRVKPARGGLWSDPRSINFTTLQDYPEEGAMTTEGGFAEEECQEGVRVVYVYLVPPEELSWNGKLTNYSLVYVPAGERSNISDTAEIDSVFHQIHLSCSLEYDVYISVYNKIGSSPPSHLHIPRQDKDFRVRDVVLEKNNTEYELVFDVQVHPLTLTLFWCLGSFNNEYQCYGKLTWRLVNRSQSSIPIDYNSSYVYGISMTTNERRNGISWAKCIFDVENVPAPPSVESRPEHGLTVSLRADRCLSSGLVSTYTVQHCAPQHQHCRDTTLASDYREYVIRELDGGVNYSVRVRKTTVSGKRGPFSQPVFAVTRGLTKTEVTSLAVGLAVGAIIILSFMLGCARRMWRTYHQKETITLPIPFEDCAQQVENSTAQGYSWTKEEPSPPLPERNVTRDQRGEGDIESSALPDTDLRVTLDVTDRAAKVPVTDPGWGGSVNTDHEQSDGTLDPYVTAAINEDYNNVDV